MKNDLKREVIWKVDELDIEVTKSSTTSSTSKKGKGRGKKKEDEEDEMEDEENSMMNEDDEDDLNNVVSDEDINEFKPGQTKPTPSPVMVYFVDNSIGIRWSCVLWIIIQSKSR